MKKIFIVEDETMFANMLSDYISDNAAVETTIFSTGEQCLAALSQKPNLIILDYHLNGVDNNAANGMKILQEIKKMLPHTTVIMLSSQESYSVAAQTISKGAAHYVIKSNESFEEVVQIINNSH